MDYTPHLHDMRIHTGTDYLTVYKNMSTHQGCVLKARELVIEMMIRDEGLTPFGARQILRKLISEDIVKEANKAKSA